MANRLLLSAVAAIIAAAFASPASASFTYLDFENIAPYPNASDVQIKGYYGGGTSSIGTTGANYGVEFTSEARLICLNTAGTNCSDASKGGLGIPSSAFGALYFPDANPTMNVAGGFDTAFSFTYSAFDDGTTVDIYSGLDGSGTLLASLALAATPTGGCNDSISYGATYCAFDSASIPFAGTAMSVVFNGVPARQVFDDFAFSARSALPEPATWAMMLAGFGAVGVSLRRKRALAIQ